MRLSRIGLFVGGAFTALLMVTPQSAAVALTPVAALGAAALGPVSSTPVSWTPSLAPDGNVDTVEQIRQIVPCGAMMYAVGTFTVIKQNGVVYPRNNAFSFNATTGAVSGWNPNVNGTVNSVALSAGCATAYLGGKFTMIGSQSATNLASVSSSTGVINAGFKHNANGQVNALLVSGNHVLAGGYFTEINTSVRGYLASLNPSTGDDDGYVNLNISGNYVYADPDGDPAHVAGANNTTRVYNFALNPAKNRVLVMGVFTSVGGLARRQIFMLSLNASDTAVHPWYSTGFDQNCHWQFPFWLQDASWSPDGAKIYIATTGFKPNSGPGYSVAEPRAGLCDVAASYPATAGLVTPQWVNYTGCDSLFSTAADAKNVYVGGHQRWMSNPKGCGNNNNAGTGVIGVDAPGLAGLSPASGAVTFNPTRGRGVGAVDMVVTAAGLWIASDNFEGAENCGGVGGHAGICFLPYKGVETRVDYDGDGLADRAVWRPLTGQWSIEGAAPLEPFGQSGDVPVAGDFTGGTQSDFAVYRPSAGQWHIKGLPTAVFGNSTDKPVAADYIGDDKADIAVWRPSTGTWFVRGGAAVTYGVNGDIPVPADFTGDGKADFAVWRPSTGQWHIRGLPTVVWGVPGDRPAVGDFTGDGKADVAIWRPSNGTWYVRNVSTTVWGVGGDIPVAGDFTGDGKADIAIWRPSDGKWWIRNVSSISWGASGDVPLYG